MPKQVIWSCKNEKKNIYYLPTVNLKVSTGKNVHAFRADIIQNEKKICFNILSVVSYKMLSDNFRAFVGYYLTDCMLSKGYLKLVIPLSAHIL